MKTPQDKATVEVIVKALATAWSSCINKANGLSKARTTLEQAGVNVDYTEVNKAMLPHEDAAKVIQEQLASLGYVIGKRFGEFVPRTGARLSYADEQI